MLQKLARRMGMGESRHQEPKIPARPHWPVDAVSWVLRWIRPQWTKINMAPVVEGLVGRALCGVHESYEALDSLG